MNAKRVVFASAVATLGAVLISHLSPPRAAIAAAPQNQDSSACTGLPSFSALKSAITAATAMEASGLNNQMWATIVNRDGVVQLRLPRLQPLHPTHRIGHHRHGDAMNPGGEGGVAPKPR